MEMPTASNFANLPHVDEVCINDDMVRRSELFVVLKEQRRRSSLDVVGALLGLFFLLLLLLLLLVLLQALVRGLHHPLNLRKLARTFVLRHGATEDLSTDLKHAPKLHKSSLQQAQVRTLRRMNWSQSPSNQPVLSKATRSLRFTRAPPSVMFYSPVPFLLPFRKEHPFPLSNFHTFRRNEF